MSQEEQNEWPSFEAVLRDVAPSDVARRTQTAIATSRRALASVDAARDERRDAAVARAEPHVESIGQRGASEDPFSLDLLPAPLPPLELDTSAVRALLEQRGANIDALDFELEALAPLDIAESQLGEPDVAEPELDDRPEVASVLDLAFSDSTFQHEPTQEIELPDFSGTPMEIFDDLGFENELAFDAGPFVEEQFEDVPSGSVFELDESAITASEGDVPESDASDGNEQAEDDHEELHSDVPVLDTFDSVATADEIEGDLSELFTLDTEFTEPAIEDEESYPVESDPVESDPVETDSFDNVVPIRPAPDGSAIHESDWTTETPNEQFQPGETQPAVDAKHTGWVGLADTVKTSDEVEDPWAYMRPADESTTKSVWARRPKFFGGDERKRRKTERHETATHAAEAQDRGDAELEIEFDSECPNCGGECQVDLDDPIGRRVHVSCPSCDHMWFTPYVIESKTG